MTLTVSQVLGAKPEFLLNAAGDVGTVANQLEGKIADRRAQLSRLGNSWTGNASAATQRQGAEMLVAQARTTSATPGANTPTVAPVATTTVRPNVSPDEECAGSKFSVTQFIGAWQDGSTVTTLSEHGSLDSNTNGDKQFGTWQFKPAGQTPAASSVPVPETCVLWFHWMDEPQQDAFYVPLKVSDTSLQLSYVGRGNTIVWERAAG